MSTLVTTCMLFQCYDDSKSDICHESKCRNCGGFGETIERPNPNFQRVTRRNESHVVVTYFLMAVEADIGRRGSVHIGCHWECNNNPKDGDTRESNEEADVDNMDTLMEANPNDAAKNRE